MSATSEQEKARRSQRPPVPAATIPMVMYDSVNRVITVEVVVTQSPDDREVTISAPPVAIPSGTWTVSWELVVSPTAGFAASFAQTGIILPETLPPLVTSLVEPSGSGMRWTAQFKNEVLDVEAFHYDVGIDSSSGTGKRRAPLHLTTLHDPTIAVVKDPKDPPT